ncbi:hypothetical protein TIFTF001_028562 [Ficus carica]|uniref:Retrotransposon gag domain-containing protein n=1 Tax=Ficus carica TaxID=3494 RepID=A0AA88DQ16_FICCA|nr:hypothetical protein TIFTF001_028562 [Ficus carica]
MSETTHVFSVVGPPPSPTSTNAPFPPHNPDPGLLPPNFTLLANPDLGDKSVLTVDNRPSPTSRYPELSIYLEAFPVEPSTLGTEYRTGLAPTSTPGPYSASNPGLGIGHVDDPPAVDATHLLLSPVKSPPAANHSDGHCCRFTGDTHGTLPLTVEGLRPRGVHLLGQHHTGVPIILRCSHFADTTPVSPSFRGAPILQVIACGATDEFQPGNPDHIGCCCQSQFGINILAPEGGPEPPPLQQLIPSPSSTRHTMDEHTNQDIQEYDNPAPTVLMEAFCDAHNVQLPQRQPEAAESTPNRPPRSASRCRDPSPTAVRSGWSHRESAGRQQHEEGEPSRMRSRSRRSRVNLSEAPEHPDPTGNNPDDDRREVVNVRRNTLSVFNRLGKPEIYRRLGREASVDKPAERESCDQSRLDYLQRQLDRLVGQQYELEPAGSADPPVTPSIMASPYPSRFKMPTMPSYDGSTDADEHLENYQAHMLIQSANEAALCKSFCLTLTGAARQWYWRLPPGLIDSFQQLASSFLAALGSRTKKLGASHLFGIKQRENETLKKYLERFDKAVVQAENCTDDTLIQALREGIKDTRLIWTLAYDRPTSFAHLRGIAWRHVEADEYVRGRGLEVQDQDQPPSKRSERGQNRQDKGKFVEKIITPAGQSSRATPAARQNPGPSNRTEEPKPEHIVHTIFDGTATGDTASSRRSYAREARRFARGEHINMAEHISKICRQDSPPITFTDDEADRLLHSHNDALVGEIRVANNVVRRVLIDNGSAADVIFMDAFSRLKIEGATLTPTQTPLYRFTGDCVRAAGTVHLPVTIGDGQEKATQMVEFIVVDRPSVYNVILGRPTLNTLKAVVSTYHLAMKFPTSDGIGVFRGNQEGARKCYMEAVNKVCRKVGVFRGNQEGARKCYMEAVNKVCRKALAPATVATILAVDEAGAPSGEVKPLADLDPRISEEEIRALPVEDLISFQLEPERPERTHQRVTWIPRAKNAEADALARLALGNDLEGLVSFPIEKLDQPSIDREEMVLVAENTPTWMDPITRYLAESQLPKDREEARRIRNTSARYTLIDGKLYRRGLSTPYQRCVGPAEAEYIMKEIHNGQALIRMAVRNQIVARYYDKKFRLRVFRVGDLVMKRVLVQELGLGSFGPKWDGPYTITGIVRPRTYRLSDRDGRNLGLPWNTDHLKRFYQ